MRHLRTTLAGLMGIVLVAALGLAALRVASPFWAGVTYLAIRAILGLAILNVVYARGARRAWWLGFTLFGWGWLISPMSRMGWTFPSLLISSVLLALAPYLGHEHNPTIPPGQVDATQLSFLQIGYDLWTILFALIGAILGRIVFTRSPRDLATEPEVSSIEPATRKRWLRPVLLLWLAALLGCSIAALRSTWDFRVWVGATFLLTCGLLGLLILGAINDRGGRRQAWLGGALFGGGYMLAAFTLMASLPTSQLLAAARASIPSIAHGTVAANARIHDALETPVAMTFPDPTPLRDVLRYVTLATSTPTYAGIPIYLDPIELQEAEATPTSPVTIDLVNTPLRESLRICLKPLGLDYEIRDGILQVCCARDVEDSGLETFDLVDGGFAWIDRKPSRRILDTDDPFIQVGHCLIALLAAGFGALMAPLVADPPRGQETRVST